MHRPPLTVLAPTVTSAPSFSTSPSTSLSSLSSFSSLSSNSADKDHPSLGSTPLATAGTLPASSTSTLTTSTSTSTTTSQSVADAMTVAKLDPASTLHQRPLTPSSPTSSSKGFPSADSSSAGLGSPKLDSPKLEVKEKEKATRPRVLGPKMNPVYKGVRAFFWVLYFNLGASLISMTQILSLPLAILAPGVYRRHINRTEGHFGAFLLKMNQLFAPSDFVLTGDASIRGILNKAKTEEHQQTVLDMPERMIFISNHQGMRFFDFILLKRNDWAHDKRAIEENLDRVNKKDPLWLVVFPEGTVVSKGTRKRSTAFAEKAGLKDHRHVLLPRTSGLFVCINKLRGSVEYLYDATVGYSGIHYGEVPQELYPLPGLYLNKAQPKEINMHLRRFALKEIPETEPEFVEWVRARWQEKDELMEEFYTKGKFPSELTLDSDAEEEEIEKTNGEERPKIGSSASASSSSSSLSAAAKIEKARGGGQSLRFPLRSRAMLDYLSPSALNVIALPLLAVGIRYVLQHSS
ncbi:hypothetical protein EMPS_08739 [Entomortierella parvispora]|uniref:Acyltransferase C-terminal domain-containing protein n=1 Tax=Entomortierella parvispora TaxID=205924 RepID=A0A9P3HGM3_9FUNG|nr:hypothetical protein EMPS_08739 [Entomortierella parvispora]